MDQDLRTPLADLRLVQRTQKADQNGSAFQQPDLFVRRGLYLGHEVCAEGIRPPSDARALRGIVFVRMIRGQPGARLDDDVDPGLRQASDDRRIQGYPVFDVGRFFGDSD